MRFATDQFRRLQEPSVLRRQSATEQPARRGPYLSLRDTSISGPADASKHLECDLTALPLALQAPRFE